VAVHRISIRGSR